MAEQSQNNFDHIWKHFEGKVLSKKVPEKQEEEKKQEPLEQTQAEKLRQEKVWKHLWEEHETK